MKRIAICDDDELVCSQLNNIISNYIKSRNILAEIITFSSGKALCESIQTMNISCLFMDIDLKEDKNGVEIIKFIREFQKTMIVIFVTSYSEFTNIVLPLHTFDYINKPFKNVEITKVLDDVFLWLKNEDSIGQNKVQFKTINGLISLNVEEILYFEYKNRRIDIVTKTFTYHMYGKIRDIFKELDNSIFAVPHISYIVNMNEIKSVIKSKYTLIMTNGITIPISQLKIKEFLKKYMTFLKKWV